MDQSLTFKQRWRYATPYLLFCCLIFAAGDLLHGVDTGSFGSLQALPSFLQKFGQLQPDGEYKLSTERKSLMNSVVWIGKITGTIVFEPVAERFGYKVVMYIVAVLQCIGVIIQLTAKDWIVFSVGREFSYLAAGMVENAVPSYQGELSPAPLRGFFAGSLMGINTAGNVWGAAMSRAYATEQGRIGYMVPVAVQLAPAILIIIAMPLCVESPRWLIAKDRRDEAQKSLDRVRPRHEVESGSTANEIVALHQAIQDAEMIGSGSWLDLFRGTYLRRTIISGLMFFFQQTTGSQFVNSYGPTSAFGPRLISSFFTSIGLGAQSFTYQTLANTVAVVGCTACILLCDKIGRRPILIVGTFLTIIFNVVIATCGSKQSPSPAETQAVIASFILLLGASRSSIGSLAYLNAAEIGGVRMRKKTIAWATAIDVISAFLITFSFPYLLGTPGANLKAKVGWIMAGLAVLSFIFAGLFVPELANRSLEEVDELFGRKLWAWKFAKAETNGVGARIAQLEGAQARMDAETELVDVDGDTKHLEQTIERVDRV